MITKMVNGNSVILSIEEERKQRAFWDLNAKYPEYVGHCGWDGVNEPFHDIVQCRKHHASLMKKAVETAMQDLNSKIEIAQEENNPQMQQSLLAQRKTLRSHESMDFSSYQTVEQLIYSVPQELKPYWNK